MTAQTLLSYQQSFTLSSVMNVILGSETNIYLPESVTTATQVTQSPGSLSTLLLLHDWQLVGINGTVGTVNDDKS